MVICCDGALVNASIRRDRDQGQRRERYEGGGMRGSRDQRMEREGRGRGKKGERRKEDAPVKDRVFHPQRTDIGRIRRGGDSYIIHF
jgi:hypothetical protein